MTVSPFDSDLHGPLLGDWETAAFFSDAAAIHAMLEVEAALAAASAGVGLIPDDAATAITAAVNRLQTSKLDFAAETGQAGVPVPALVNALREEVGPEQAGYVHWGATSQDIVDSGLAVRLGKLINIYATSLRHLILALAELADKHRHSVMLGRTRTQAATPITFGLKVANWLAPLLRHRDRLDQLRPRLLVLSLGGASGNMSQLGPDGQEVAQLMALRLGLGCPDIPWHNQRDGMAEFAGWLSLVSGALGKIGADMAQMCQSEIGELRLANAGGSSTMPQKSNPVGAEILQAMARFNAGNLANMHNALPHAMERDGAAWTLEWLSLPQMAAATGRGMMMMREMLAGLRVDTGRMAENLHATKGLALAEAATFALSAHMLRAEAVAQVKEACLDVEAGKSDLVNLLRQRCDAPVDWAALADPANATGPVDRLIDAVIISV